MKDTLLLRFEEALENKNISVVGRAAARVAPVIGLATITEK